MLSGLGLAVVALAPAWEVHLLGTPVEPAPDSRHEPGLEGQAVTQAQAQAAAGARLCPLHRRRQALLAAGRPPHPGPRGRGPGGAAQALTGPVGPSRVAGAGRREGAAVVLSRATDAPRR